MTPILRWGWYFTDGDGEIGDLLSDLYASRKTALELGPGERGALHIHIDRGQARLFPVSVDRLDLSAVSEDYDDYK